MKRLTKGFTLAETLIAVVVFGIFSILVTGIFLNVLKGTTRQEILREVKQNGDYALSVIISDIQSAKDVTTGCSTPPSPVTSIELLNTDGTTYTYEAADRPGSGTLWGIKRTHKTDSGTIVSEDYLTSENVQIAQVNPPSNTAAVLSFTCYSSISGDRIKVKYTLLHAKSILPIRGRQEEYASIPFEGLAIVRSQ